MKGSVDLRMNSAVLRKKKIGYDLVLVASKKHRCQFVSPKVMAANGS